MTATPSTVVRTDQKPAFGMLTDTIDGTLTTGQQSAVTQAANGSPLDIALVHASDAGGGAERSVLTLHQTLRRLGHQADRL